MGDWIAAGQQNQQPDPIVAAMDAGGETVVIGYTGSGKSTLVLLMGGSWGELPEGVNRYPYLKPARLAAGKLGRIVVVVDGENRIAAHVQRTKQWGISSSVYLCAPPAKAGAPRFSLATRLKLSSARLSAPEKVFVRCLFCPQDSP